MDQYLGSKTKACFLLVGLGERCSPRTSGTVCPARSPPRAYYKTRTNSYRFTVDETITPTFLVHIGVGEERYVHTDSAPPGTLNYNAVQNLGLVGASKTPSGFPQINITANADGGGFNPSFTGPGSTGATATMGPTNAGTYLRMTIPRSPSSVTWVRGNHTFKAGAEGRKNIWSDVNVGGTFGVYNFNNSETGLPYLQSLTLNGGSVGSRTPVSCSARWIAPR
jgi:hypothetical protein